jgi:hypothetical protein
MGSIIGSVIASAVFKTTAAKIIGGIVIGAVVSKAISWVRPKPDLPEFDFAESEASTRCSIK